MTGRQSVLTRQQSVGQRHIQIPRASQVAVGNSFMAALSTDGDVWVWFVDRAPIGQLDPDRDDRVPVKLAPLPPRSAWAGWEKDESGPRTNRAEFEARWRQRGGTDTRQPSSVSDDTEAGSGSNTSSPKLDSERVVRIACGWEEVLALKANGELWLGSAHGRSWDFVESRPLPSTNERYLTSRAQTTTTLRCAYQHLPCSRRPIPGHSSARTTTAVAATHTLRTPCGSARGPLTVLFV